MLALVSIGVNETTHPAAPALHGRETDSSSATSAGRAPEPWLPARRLLISRIPSPICSASSVGHQVRARQHTGPDRGTRSSRGTPSLRSSSPTFCDKVKGSVGKQDHRGAPWRSPPRAPRHTSNASKRRFVIDDDLEVDTEALRRRHRPCPTGAIEHLQQSGALGAPPPSSAPPRRRSICSAKQRVRIAVLEVGLGGAADSTNVVHCIVK